MADINKCDIEGETRTAYRLKEGVPIAIFDMDSYFEPFELPVVELKPDFDSLSTINYYDDDGEKPYWKICKYQENSTAYTMIVCIGENELIKSIEDFNNRAAMLFGFYLKEPEGAEK